MTPTETFTEDPENYGYQEVTGLSKWLPTTSEITNNIPFLEFDKDLRLIQPYLDEGVGLSLTEEYRTPLRTAYQSRIKELNQYAKQDGFALNPTSESDFWSVIESVPLKQKAGLVLRENGNLRAVWKSGTGNRLALHFLGDRIVQYVIFTPSADHSDVSPISGTVSLDEIEPLIARYYPSALE